MVTFPIGSEDILVYSCLLYNLIGINMSAILINL